MATTTSKATLSQFHLATSSNPAPPVLKPTLLVCDDEEGPRQSLRIVFKNDYNVLVAASGIEALSLAKHETIDVAVLDILMQGMSGVEVLRELKAIDPAIEVVMLTAYETLETARQALRFGASDYLNKPFDIPTMRTAVTRAFEKRRAALTFRDSHQQLESLHKEIADHRVREEMARTKGEIYASVLHDINSPLTVISGFVELINRSMQNTAQLEGEQLETIKGDLNRLHGQVGRCFEISRRYLSFLSATKVENTYVGVRQMLVDLKDLLIRHPSAMGHQLIIHDLLPDAVAEINGTDFLQILLNLTINALQAGEVPHRVEIHARRLDHPLPLSTYEDGPEERFVNRESFDNREPLLAISISDTGPGIPPEAVAKMFRERFTTKPPDKGTGLGLSIVRRLATEAKAAVHLKTKIGQGSTFTVVVRMRG
jgi:two-component system sensor histidine kinase/response regulator